MGMLFPRRGEEKRTCTVGARLRRARAAHPTFSSHSIARLCQASRGERSLLGAQIGMPVLPGAEELDQGDVGKNCELGGEGARSEIGGLD